MSPQPRWEAYRFLLDKEEAVGASLVLPTGIDPASDFDVDTVASLLRALFVADERLTAVSLRVGDTKIGAAGRDRLLHLTDHRLRSAVEGDGAELPGPSAQYRLLAYTCRTAGCPAAEWHVVVPDRSPLCPNGHGLLEYAP
ncbi:hypothetical protein AB0I82_13850 [Streptomyces sp. NPDC050315]|uniref:hypothetical protein n=1 Tax=Streptomyces sp. NPDC050315 TaxID=3155039 RepID=UPI00343C4E4C